ncbi:hypothetical protein F4778DRAFT_135603 [Xylariomycetidae sp. FL2044]|nr:hypothetical protein F4778DRAFT_135603 [Xylariomycetidae sp. FL2044]
MAPQPKTNFKTYEASTRLLAAVIATTNVKLDFKALAAHVGGGTTEYGLQHRLRPIKQLAKMQAVSVKKGEDPGELPVEKGEIHKLFGESTPGGLEWQFREIKQLGKQQQKAVKEGKNPADVTPQNAKGATPRGKKTETPTSSSTARTPGTGYASKKRGRKSANYADLDSDNDDEAEEVDDDLEDPIINTPTKKPAVKKVKPTPEAPTASPRKPSKTAPAPVSTSGNGTSMPHPAGASMLTRAPATVDSYSQEEYEVIDLSGPDSRSNVSIKQEPTAPNNPFEASDLYGYHEEVGGGGLDYQEGDGGFDYQEGDGGLDYQEGEA